MKYSDDTGHAVAGSSDLPDTATNPGQYYKIESRLNLRAVFKEWIV